MMPKLHLFDMNHSSVIGVCESHQFHRAQGINNGHTPSVQIGGTIIGEGQELVEPKCVFIVAVPSVQEGLLHEIGSRCPQCDRFLI